MDSSCAHINVSFLIFVGSKSCCVCCPHEDLFEVYQQLQAEALGLL